MNTLLEAYFYTGFHQIKSSLEARTRNCIYNCMRLKIIRNLMRDIFLSLFYKSFLIVLLTRHLKTYTTHNRSHVRIYFYYSTINYSDPLKC